MSEDEQKNDAAVEAAEETTVETAPVAEEVKEAAPVAEKKVEAPAEEAEVEVPAKFKKLVEEIEKMTVLELNELVKVFEKKFGVSAAAVAVAGPAALADAGEAKTDFEVMLNSFGEAKIAVIKVVKEVMGLGLKEAKDLVESAPASLKSGVKKEEAEELKKKLEAAGATVELK